MNRNRKSERDMKNSNVLLPVVIVTLTGITLLLGARHENTNAAEREAVVNAAAPLAEAGDVVESTFQPTEAARRVMTPNPAKLSYGLDEIARIVEAGVQPEVVEAFIDNSTIAYAPNAGDIVHLHELGAPSQVIAAVIRHGGRLREQGIREFKEAQATPSRQVAAVGTAPVVYATAEQPAQLAAVTYNTCTCAHPAVVRPDYPVYGYAGLQYASYPRCNYSYSRYSVRRHCYPTFFSSCRPYTTYNYCAPRFIRPAVTVGFSSYRYCRPGMGLRLGTRL